MKPNKITTVFLCLFLSAHWINAQIVNIEKKRTSYQDSVYWTGDIRLSAAFVQNSKTITSISGSIRLDHVRYKHSFLSITSYNLGRVEKEDFINDGFQHFRYNYKINKRLAWEAFTQIQYNERIHLQMRWLLGTGPRLALLLKENQQLYIGTLYMYEYDEEKQGEDQVVYFRDHRLSSYLNLHLQPLEYIKLNSTTYFQPVLGRFSDWRLSSETSLQIKVTKRLTFNVIFTILYDSRAREGVPKTIYSLKNGLQLSF